MKAKSIPAGAAKLRNALVASTIELYQTVQVELLPTPMKSHYTFNLRDVSKVRRCKYDPNLKAPGFKGST